MKSEAINETNRVSRYFTVDGFLSFLESKKLHFTRLNKFIDSNDGMVNSQLALDKAKYLFRTISAGYGSMPAKVVDDANDRYKKDLEYRANVYASCWTAHDHESHALWSLYTDHGKGILFRCDLDTLISSINEQSIQHRSIKYSKSDVDLSSPDFSESIFTKAKYFSLENEYRFLLDCNKHSLPENHILTERGFLLPISLDYSKTWVQLGYGLDSWTARAVKTAITQFGYPANQIRLSEINWNPETEKNL